MPLLGEQISNTDTTAKMVGKNKLYPYPTALICCYTPSCTYLGSPNAAQLQAMNSTNVRAGVWLKALFPVFRLYTFLQLGPYVTGRPARPVPPSPAAEPPHAPAAPFAVGRTPALRAPLPPTMPAAAPSPATNAAALWTRSCVQELLGKSGPRG